MGRPWGPQRDVLRILLQFKERLRRMLLEDRADPDVVGGDAELPAVDPVALSKPFLEDLVIDMDVPSGDSGSSGSSSSSSSSDAEEDDEVIYVAPAAATTATAEAAPPPPPPEEAAPRDDGMDAPFVVR